ncbi:dihydrolipoyl dehydrogenase family protein [Galbibacter mesophilus]|uniref:dihydrolipoyl dehydrogenase family protein n=1 Tax=Galbibacter mesophilus TaxID=379069 RepID=UPI00191CC9C7|nr:NAD(P)/FAD-dependent oxidoreductase [Galbibacter mesophilus]MCM5662013.1 NAD(P)/FAD-dependent oxidoreductase [Galbibacter mesophilus]
MKIDTFDVFVVGSGVAGQRVAYACAKEGLKVAVADNREFGGTCANRGCDPKKVILAATEIVQKATDLEGKGISELPKTDWKQVMEFKKKFTAKVPRRTEENLEEAGIKMYHQSPEFLDKNTLLVEGKKVEAKKIVIATGQHPRKLEITGASNLLTSDNFLSLESLPKSMIFVGAGYVGMELAHMAARFGVDVTVVDRLEAPLSKFDKDMVEILVKASEAIGIKFIFDAEVTSVEKLQKNFRLSYTKDKKEKEVKAEMVFNTSGRVPSIEDLNLEKGEVSFNEKGIEVDAFLQNTTNQNVYACGDVSAHALPLTPFSTKEAKVVAENIIKGNTTKATLEVTPSVVFTLPNVASVGITEEESKKLKKEVEIKTATVPYWFNAKRIHTEFYAYKTIVEKNTGKILGAHLVGPQAAEVINLFAMAIYNGMTATDLKGMVLTYPSWGSDIQSMV